MSKQEALIKRVEELTGNNNTALKSASTPMAVEWVLVARYTLASMEAFRAGNGGGDKNVILEAVAKREGVFPDHNGWPPMANNETNYEFRVPNRSVEPTDTYHYVSARIFADPAECLTWLRGLPAGNFFLNAASEVTFSTQVVA